MMGGLDPRACARETSNWKSIRDDLPLSDPAIKELVFAPAFHTGEGQLDRGAWSRLRHRPSRPSKR